MTTLHDEVARRRHDAVVRRGGETFVEIDTADELISEAERQGIRILGVEGFLIAKARVAVARKVLTLVYYGLRDGEIRCLAQARTAA